MFEDNSKADAFFLFIIIVGASELLTSRYSKMVGISETLAAEKLTRSFSF